MIKGLKNSPETRKKISENHARYWSGKKMPIDSVIKSNLARSEERAHQWKGDSVGYRTLHRWVEKHLGKPDTCVHCKTSGLVSRQIHWANVSGTYKRTLDDWIRLCVKCHSAYDRSRNGN